MTAMQDRSRFGFARAAQAPVGAGMTSLVDILLSTIGVFVIVFALQEISEPTARVPAAFDGAILCDADGRYTAFDLNGGSAALPEASMAAALRAFAAEGGRFLIAITPGCAEAKTAKGGSAAGLAWTLVSDVGAQRAEAPDALHRFEIAPADDDAHSFQALMARIAPRQAPET